jgi:O-antigen/teichoic acid export membrane protein
MSRLKVIVDLIYAYGLIAIDAGVSVLINIAIPILVDVEAYGNYRKLLLYVSYAGVMHLGLLSGLYLYVLGKELPELSMSGVQGLRRKLWIVQFTCLPCIGLGLLLAGEGGYLFIGVLLTAIALSNYVTFYNYIFQGTNNFRLFFIANVSGRFSLILLLIGIFVFRCISIWMLMGTVLLPLVVSALAYKKLWLRVKTGGAHLSKPMPDWRQLWQRGMSLYFGNVLIVIFFSAGSLLVSFAASPSEFAIFAFAYGLFSISYLITDGLTVVLTPYTAKWMRSGARTNSATTALLFAIWSVPLGYWFAKIGVHHYYPKYVDSIPLLQIFMMALPFCVLVRSHVVSVVIASGRQDVLWRFALASTVAATILISGGWLLLHNMTAVAYGWASATVIAGITGVIIVEKITEKNKHESTCRPLLIHALFSSTMFIACTRIEFSIPAIYAACALVAVGSHLLRRQPDSAAAQGS